MKISTCIAAALLVASTTAGCGSCAKDEAAPVPSDTPPTALTDRKASPLPKHFERPPPPKIEGILTAPVAPVVNDAGPDAATTTH